MSGSELENGRVWVLVSILETKYRQVELFVLPIYEYRNFATFAIGTFKNWINGLTTPYFSDKYGSHKLLPHLYTLLDLTQTLTRLGYIILDTLPVGNII